MATIPQEIRALIFSGYPHLEVAYRVAKLPFPKLPLTTRAGGRERVVNTGPFGEILSGARP